MIIRRYYLDIICEVTFVDNFYRNDANHHGFIYQNPNYRHSIDKSTKWDGFKLATIYVKPQVYNGVCSPADALKQGTAFVELYSPFVGKGGQR